MKSLGLSRYALAIGAASALLAGCSALPLGSAQGKLALDDTVPSGTRGAISQTFALKTRTERGTSWMLPEATMQSLLYVSDASYYDYDDYVYVYSYPEGSLVGTLTGFTRPRGLCANKAGRVFVTDSDAGEAGRHCPAHST